MNMQTSILGNVSTTFRNLFPKHIQVLVDNTADNRAKIEYAQCKAQLDEF